MFDAQKFTTAFGGTRIASWWSLLGIRIIITHRAPELMAFTGSWHGIPMAPGEAQAIATSSVRLGDDGLLMFRGRSGDEPYRSMVIAEVTRILS